VKLDAGIFFCSLCSSLPHLAVPKLLNFSFHFTWAFPEPPFVSVCIFKTHFNSCPLALKNKISPFLFTIPVSYHLAIFISCRVSSLPSLSFQSILFTPHTTIIVQSHSFVHLLLNSSSTHRLCKISFTLSLMFYFALTPLLICRPNVASVYIPHTDRTESHIVLFFFFSM